MNFYPHHIGDFNNKTRHLSRLERSIYRDLIELYYENEEPLSLDVQQVSRRIVASEMSTDVERMLNEFFIATSAGWFHARCDEEITKYQGNTSQRAQAGRASAAKKAFKKQQALNGGSTTVEMSLNENPTSLHNQEPITNNQEPYKDKQDKKDKEKKANAAFAAESFADFWRKYPKKEGKVDALKAWNKLSLTDGLFKHILAGLQRAKLTRQWTDEQGKFIPNPATWLNGNRWEDEDAEAQAQNDAFAGLL